MSSRILGLLLIAVYCVNAEFRNSAEYTAGVVEFRPIVYGMTSADILADHLKAYDEIIRSPEANVTDIIVFPEGTLNNALQLSFVPSPDDGIIPCLDQHNEYAAFLKQLSCAARDVKKYLVINLTEKENCSSVQNDPRPCASNDLNIFNTNVVFDRDGRVISRYRKVHIYTEAKNITLNPEFGIFETDFGVRFGHFICFDINFYTPAQELIVKHGIKNVIFTSLFYSELPFLTGIQLHQSWAWGNNVNLLAAGASYPQTGTTGTGIYVGNKGYLKAIMQGDEGVRQLFVAKLPKNPDDSEFEFKSDTSVPKKQTPETGIKLMEDPQLSNYNSVLLDLKDNTPISHTLCYRNLCCDINLKVKLTELSKDQVNYKYRFGVFDGNRTYEKEEWSEIEVCALYACTNDKVDSCGIIFDREIEITPNIVFQSIEIRGYFEKATQLLIMPSTLNNQLYSLNSDAVAWTKTENSSHYIVDIKLKSENDELLTFGIYANYYERSRSSGRQGLSITIFSGILLTLLIKVFKFVFNA